MLLRVKDQQKYKVNEVLASACINSHRYIGKQASNVEKEDFTEFLSTSTKQSMKEQAINIATIINNAKL
jgi:hypothetical protein